MCALLLLASKSSSSAPFPKQPVPNKQEKDTSAEKAPEVTNLVTPVKTPAVHFPTPGETMSAFTRSAFDPASVERRRKLREDVENERKAKKAKTSKRGGGGSRRGGRKRASVRYAYDGESDRSDSEFVDDDDSEYADEDTAYEGTTDVPDDAFTGEQSRVLLVPLTKFAFVGFILRHADHASIFMV